ncbi:MAG TPA: hypothetical protein VNI01_04905 [Elusimicrobiota bacterium]|jgi:hypothetical protein|nr:hypothetical protein [Elusimicrobiota bacterium]
MKPRLALLLAAAALPAPAMGASVEVHPYGFLMANYAQAWGRANAADVPTQAVSGGVSAASNQNTSLFTARQSRIGLGLSGGKGPWDSDLSGVLEADFFGPRNSGSSSSDALAAAPRLRLAYIQARRGDDVVVFGQDWIKAFAPLNPTSLAHTGTAPLSNSGNLWNRIPQLRWDRAWGLPRAWAINTKLALVRSFTGDETGRTATAGGTTFAVPASLDTAGSGEFSGGPAYQALVELDKTAAGRHFVAGLSGQYLRETFNAALPPPGGASNNQVAGWLVAAHFSLPFHPLFELSGEAFYGHGNQNVNGLGSVYSDLGSVRQSQVRGGWAQAAARARPDLRFDVMAGFEDVDQTGLAVASIYRNEAMALNAIWDASPELALSVELGRIHSYYVAALAGDSENLGFAAQYKFGGKL